MENQLFVEEHYAKYLKEIGFSMPCFARYRNNKFQYNTLGKPIDHNTEQYAKGDISAPTYQQAFDFIYQKYNIFCYSKPFISNKDVVWFYKIDILFENKKNIKSFSNINDSLDISNKKCIQEVVRIIKLIIDNNF